MGTPLRLALLISGGGTTMEAIIKACQDGGLLYGKIQPAVVIASRPDAGGIAKAKWQGIRTRVVVPCQPAERFGEQILAVCREFGVDHVGQYGWLPMTPEIVIAAYPRALTNQHPAPPEFGGKGMHGKAPHCAVIEFQRAVGWRDPWTEAICQWVAPGAYDTGAVLYRLIVPLFCDDDTDTLATRVLPVEWLVQIQALELFANERLHELPPRQPLVRPNEMPLLEMCKGIARERYPNG
ncbi:MAG: formyltransferase family protein [Patescibacteria group bacterium]|nr:formyltransferase family protein [Patescibacteria group bacterium]